MKPNANDYLTCQSPFMYVKLTRFIERQHIGYILRKAVANIFLQPEANEPVIVRCILFFHEFEEIILRYFIKRFCDLRRIAINIEVFFYALYQSTCK